MLSRNQIRQAALQYLYAASQTPETEREGIWDILMEPFRFHVVKLKADSNVCNGTLDCDLTQP